ncbi:hypothetical protein BKA66DRAFT_508811 [Pyrenochaeta sp. MPI-SDFR-AT-0127]|nr:hypothetical protein BKA66DRAFT_508811 [Pyrenochaeta sp. MPI-SDFR-AT-0127]
MTSLQNNLTSSDEGSSRVTPSNLCFSSLPAELRNNVYAQTLRWQRPLILIYQATTHRFQVPSSNLAGARTPLQALEMLSSLDHYIRQEARSYFFANNCFEIKTKQNWSTDPDYVQVYINFLEDIGETGRRSLRNVRLTVSGDSKLHRPNHEQAMRFWNLLASCMNLERLDLFLEVDYFYMDQRKALHSYLSTCGLPITDPWPVVLQSLCSLTNLKHLFLHVVYSSRWRHVEAKFLIPGGICQLDPFERIHFKLKRPIDEAAELSDQIKGVLRARLRRRVAIRTFTTETWNQYGADVLFERVPKGCDDLGLVAARRVTRRERGF